ncbi:BTB/POZ domain-containing protein 8 [Frankliniella fusca]|uniref:BTB/POZ domain-containing protein 8 n=1 Tax=Frankliniella fusca TaxID=407009 RepID=A0AAE1H701_9NEOP|nr:BTB/POZ domain-containing protein 8 [Frankliniella fusca]
MAADEDQKICDFELKELTKKLQQGLKRDISRIFTNSLFCDLEIKLGDSSLFLNCCILQVRARSFYCELCSLHKLCGNGFELDINIAKEIKCFAREIYEEDNIKPIESYVVQYLKSIAFSPDFDQYTTPLSSPVKLDAKGSALVSEPTSYYSIVPLDWERELAEQDFLSESLSSILRKEENKSEANSLLKPHSKRKFPQNQEENSQNLLKLKRAIEEDILLLQEEGFLPNIDENSFLDSKLKSIHCSVNTLNTLHLNETCNECGFFDAEDSSSLYNDSLADMQRGVFDRSKMSSNVETGPDSGLATSAEDIPLDQENGLEISKSISSSLSSDCCVWDANATHQRDMTSWVDNAPHQDGSGIQADFVDRVLQELVGKSQQMQDNNPVSNGLECSGVGNTPRHGFFIDASSLLDETEINAPNIALAQDNNVKEQSSMNLGASSEEILEGMPELLGNMTVGTSSSCKLIKECDGSSNNAVCPHSSESKDSDCESPDNSLCQNEPISELGNLEARHVKPPSLIRSNTFELETEDDRLAILRQDYERRQGSLIFQRHISQNSGPLSDVGSGSENDLNQHCTSLILPEIDSSLTAASMSLFPTHVVDDEIQTPDSLNSDLLEANNQDKLEMDRVEECEPVSIPEKNDTSDLNTVKVKNPGFCPLNELSSPLLARRKTEGAPILSGAAPPLSPEKKPERKAKGPLTSSFPSAWVVDISDITNSPEPGRRKEMSLGSSYEVQTNDSKDWNSFSDPKSLSSSLGFFVDLNNPNVSCQDTQFGTPCPIEGNKILRQSSESGKSEKQNACEFFVDLKSPCKADEHSVTTSEETQSTEKKLFSMFIDIGEKGRPKAKPELTSRTRTPLSPFSLKRRNVAPASVAKSESINGKQCGSNAEEKESTSMTSLSSVSSQHSAPIPTTESKKNSFFIFIDSEQSSNIQKGPLSSRISNNHPHSNGKEKYNPRKHVRANSVSSIKKSVITNTGTSLALSSSSRHLSSQSLQNVEMDVQSDDIAKPMFSSFHVSLPLDESHEEKSKRNQEVESSDLSSHLTTGSNGSSACSLETYSVHTPEQSSATDEFPSEKKDLLQNVKENNENVLHNPKCFQEIAAAKRGSVCDGTSSTTEGTLKTETKNMKSFVRLSDLDKEPISLSDQNTVTVSHRMSRSIPETSWIERKSFMSRSTGGGSTVMSSSSRSLSRLFPHMSMSSVNQGRSKTSSTCSQLTEDMDAMRSSQFSDMSSMQSSTGLEYSTESTDISSDHGSPSTQLGDDLLKMFLEEINTDVIVEVGGRRIKAHKCILSSRCQYFAAILSGGWVESAGNVISLQGFSYTVVHFALCHIYCGTSTIPDQISIVELASLADMLSLEGLKDVIMYTLKVKYCHFFHKPCAICSVGVLECLPLAAAYGLDDIYRKSLRWITKYFVRIWPTKTFTTLPRELVEKCYQQHVIHMTADNVMETILCCDKLLSTIPTVRWAEPIFVLTSRLMETCIKYMSDNFCSVLTSDNFLALGREVPWNISRFQENLVTACERMPPDQSCRSYSQLCSVLSVIGKPEPPPEMNWHPNFIELLVQLRDLSERTLIRQAARAARTPGWGLMPTELRRKIQDSACLVLSPADHASSRYKRSVSEGTRQSSQRSSYSRNIDLHQVKMAMVQHARRSHSNDQHHTISSVVVRKNTSSDKSNTVSRRSVPVVTNKPPEKSNSMPAQGRPKTWPAQVKSRYLEKRTVHSKETVETQERKKQLDAPMPQRRVQGPVKNMLISSSDSSRNSSPAMKRSSHVSGANAKPTDSTSRVRAASNPSQSSKEDRLSGNADNFSRQSLSSNIKNQTASETSKYISRKYQDSAPRDLPSNDVGAKLDGVNSLTSSTLGTQSQSISMSNDSLATVSSCDDIHLPDADKNQKSKSSVTLKSSLTQNTGAGHLNSTKKIDGNVQRTPLTLANKKASPSVAHRKASPLASKASEGKVVSSTLMNKRSISHMANTKSPVLSSAGSRLAIPLRTSRSVSSVPDKGYLKANSSSDGLLSRRSTGKDQPRSISGVSTKRASTGSSTLSSSSLAGRASTSKGSKSFSNDSRNGNVKNNVKVNGDCCTVINAQPTVGPRSGTFLKDEPSVLKTPVVENNQL